MTAAAVAFVSAVLLVTGRAGAPPGRVVVPVVHQRQGHNLCVPTAAAMALAGYGASHAPADLKRRATPAGSPLAGTLPADMARAAGELGFPWSVRYHLPTAAGGRAGLDGIRRTLRRGRPVLADLHVPPIGHTVLVNGFDAAGRTVLYVDPDAAAPGQVEVGEDEFLRRWRSVVVPVRVAIHTAPKPDPS